MTCLAMVLFCLSDVLQNVFFFFFSGRMYTCVHSLLCVKTVLVDVSRAAAWVFVCSLINVQCI